MDSIISLVGDGGKSKILVTEVTKTANAGEEISTIPTTNQRGNII